MKKILIFAACLTTLVACTTKEEVMSPTSQDVRFYPPLTRATDTEFETGDVISVTAMLPSAGTELKEAGNFADNVHYAYRNGMFMFVPESGKEAIKLPIGGEGLAYYAIYPQQEVLKTKGTFAVQSDQRSHANRTASDFCTVYKPASNEENIVLDFWHRMSRICVNIQGVPSGQTVTMRLKDMYLETAFDLNAETYEVTGTSKSDIRMGEMGTNRDFEAILPPQAFNLASDLVVTIGTKEYNVTTTRSGDTFHSGMEYDCKLYYVDGVIVPGPIYETRFGGDIYPWNTKLNPLDDIIEIEESEGDDPFPAATTDYVLYDVTYNHKVLRGGSNIFTINTDKTFKRFYVGIKGIPGCLICSPVATTINGRNQYTITVIYGPDFDDDMIMLISGEEENGYITLPYEAKVEFEENHYEEGDLNINLTFSNAKDIDLHLYMPDGQHIFYDNRGGTVELEDGSTVTFGLDRDSNPNCNIDNLNNENIYIPAELIQPGTYRIEVNMYSNCDQNIETRWTINARYNDEFITPTTGKNPASGVYPVGAGNGDHTNVMEFIVTESNGRASSRIKPGTFVPIPLSDMDEMKWMEEKFLMESGQ